MKSKFMKKVLATSMATAMVAGMTACGGSDAGSDVNSTPSQDAAGDAAVEATEQAAVDDEEVSQYTVMTDENGNVYDLGGIEIIVRDWWSPAEPAEPTNDYEEAVQEYRQWAMDTYNFTIKEQAISDWGSTPQDFVDYVSTGGDENNYIFVLRSDPAVTSALSSGLMYDLASLNVFDFSDPRFASNVHKLYTKGSGVYGFNALSPEPTTGVFFNKRLLTEAGVDPNELYTLQENMEWTWDKFVEILEKVQRDVDGDGAIDIYGMTNNNGNMYNAAVWSNGGEFVGMNEAGEYIYRLEDAETVQALEWTKDTLAKYATTAAEGEQWDYFIARFQNGQAAFCVDDVYNANGNWNVMEDNGEEYGFVCFPMGPNMNDYTNRTGGNIYAIPACYDEETAWKLAFAYARYTDPVPGYEDYKAWEAMYLSQFPDTEAVDYTIARMMENCMITYDGIIPNLETGRDLLWNLDGAESVSAAIEATRDKWKLDIANAN